MKSAFYFLFQFFNMLQKSGAISGFSESVTTEISSGRELIFSQSGHWGTQFFAKDLGYLFFISKFRFYVKFPN